ncbi:hypothetical protein [Halarchaeum nitratireducens]|uniref:DUF624 domain-containing protein n=1 Tax=Halarchaeum nitratireducens TaxID=489913 RepID=A0A830GD89_9EURY|nr:hypothetical protein [Halarchaeum nitratireducens]GGN20310.1 hypothetical protein GCM10009021_21730 [Halarchaeum nitratireducens]
MNTADDVRSVHAGLGDAFRSAYHHSVAAVVVSLGWFVASLPVVTVGPATLAAYAAIQSLREHGRVDRSEVREALAANWHNAALLSGVFVAFTVVTVAYATQYFQTGGVQAGALAVVVGYVTAHLAVVLVVAFVRLSEGASVYEAVTGGYSWTVSRPFDTVLVGFVSLGLFAVSALLTVTVCLVFPFLLFTFHVAVVGRHAT